MKIGVLGDIMLDRYQYGEINRISPEAPVPVFTPFPDVEDKLGGAANVALAVEKLSGSPVELFGAIGKDKAGEKIIELLGGTNIEPRFNIQPNTTVKTRLICNGQHVLRIDSEKFYEHSPKEYLASGNLNFEYAILSDYNKGFLHNKKKVISALNHRDIKVFCDPKTTNLTDYIGCFLLKPNKLELSKLIGFDFKPRELPDICDQIRTEYDICNVLVTLSAEGMFLSSDAGNKMWKSEAKEVFDVTGAGDIVMATVVSMFARGKTLVESIDIANKAAAICVERMGTYAPELEELG